MTERPVAVSPSLAAARRDVLLSTKLHAPGARPGFVSRSRLTERLDEALGRGLVLVCAPAGYGKTALLAGWARRRERPVAALDRSHLAQLRGDTEGTAAFASRALAESGESEWLLTSIAQGFLAVAEWHRGRLAEAERALRSSIGRWRAADQPTVTAWGGYQLGQVQRAQGRLDSAVETYRQALETTAPPGRLPLPAAGPAYVGLGEVAYQRGDLDAALRHVTEGITLCRQFAYTPPLAAGLVTLAWIRQAAGDPAGALDAIGEAVQASAGPGRALRALALAAMGEDADALAGLAGALTLACPQGYLRVFADEGAPMAALLARLIAAQRVGHVAEIPLACLARLQRAFNAAHPTPGPRSGATAAVPGIVEPLTCRELEVLGMLAAGQSNQAIASQLVVTLDTVKKHVSHVLGKLGAANRTEAVSRARRLDLIP